MEKVLCGNEDKVCIDRCPSNHGLWFDRGELKDVIHMGTIDKENKVLKLLEEMFQAKDQK